MLSKKGILLKPDETPSILRLFFIVVFFSIGWSSGFAGMLIADELLQVIFKCLFLVFGALLGVYVLVIYGLLSRIVRSTWTSWLKCQKEERKFDLNVDELSTELPVKNGKNNKLPALQFKEMHYGPEADFRSPDERLDIDISMEFNEKETGFIETQELSMDLGSVSCLSSQSSHDSVGYPVPLTQTSDFSHFDNKVKGVHQFDDNHNEIGYDANSIDQPDSDEETAL